MSSRRRLAVLAVALVVFTPGLAAAETSPPSQWPTELGLRSAPNAIRFGGVDRVATSLEIALALRGAGGYPFDTADRTSGGAGSLAEASGWWGAGTCPSSAIVVAGDTPADALAAAPLSDPTNLSDEPRLQRVAAADPFFDPIGGFDRVDTFAAPIIVTTSARSGARALAPSARTALSDLARGGCTSAREAIIVGGPSAVPVEVESELVSLGYGEVFRVAGTNRYDTAARIATALGTEAAPAGEDCADERADDGRTAMGFHGNAVIEYRADATQCELHGRTVVLADGSVGADALAAGWWTSYWQVPVLLVAADGSLPAATRSALTSIPIDTIVVLGGTARVPESVVNQAARLAGAVAGRFAGRDRYETSAILAAVFGGWYPGTSDSFVGDRVCIATSSGAAKGWPDALAAGPWCGRLAAERSSSPSRVAEPVEAATGPVPSAPPSHDAAPILLVPTGSTTPPALLKAAFPPGEFCAGDSAPGCRAPGFAIAFGGTATASDALVDSLSTVVGGDASRRPSPQLRKPFRTALDLSPVYDVAGVGPVSACVERGSLTASRWLAAYTGSQVIKFVGARDLVTEGLYEDPGGSRPLCMGVPDATTNTLVAVAAGGAGSGGTTIHGEREATAAMSDAMRHVGPIETTGEPGTSVADDAVTSWRFDDAPSSPLDRREGAVTAPIHHASVVLVLTRGSSGGPNHFVASVRVDDGANSLSGDVDGEAVRVSGRWELAGRFQSATKSGGFRATLDTQGTDDNQDDGLTWRVDSAST